MKIILVALLYATPTSEPIVKLADYVYTDMQMCVEDKEFARALLMQGAPSADSEVVTYCVYLPSEA